MINRQHVFGRLDQRARVAIVSLIPSTHRLGIQFFLQPFPISRRDRSQCTNPVLKQRCCHGNRGVQHLFDLATLDSVVPIQQRLRAISYRIDPLLFRRNEPISCHVRRNGLQIDQLVTERMRDPPEFLDRRFFQQPSPSLMIGSLPA